MLKLNPTTPINFYTKTNSYVPGEGQTESWELLTSDKYTNFYCEWRGAFGDQVLSAQAVGVKDSATIRMFYNPIIYEQLRTSQVIVVKNANPHAIKDGEIDKNNPDVYEVWGGVDNVRENNQFMEFRVRRYEGI